MNNLQQWIAIGSVALAGLGLVLHGVAQILQAMPDPQVKAAGAKIDAFEKRLEQAENTIQILQLPTRIKT